MTDKQFLSFSLPLITRMHVCSCRDTFSLVYFHYSLSNCVLIYQRGSMTGMSRSNVGHHYSIQASKQYLENVNMNVSLLKSRSKAVFKKKISLSQDEGQEEGRWKKVMSFLCTFITCVTLGFLTCLCVKEMHIL